MKRKPEVHEKAWGEEHWIANNSKYCGKKLVLKKGWRCSIHHHKVKEETFYLYSGKVLLELGVGRTVLMPGDAVDVPLEKDHRFWGLEDSVLIEFSTQHFEDDSYRKVESGQFTWEELQKILREMI